MDDACFIVGGGPSLQNFDYRSLSGKNVIAVNQAIFRLPLAQYFITMDYTWLHKSRVVSGDGRTPINRDAFRNHTAQKTFVLALSPPRLRKVSETFYVDQQCGVEYDLSMFDRIVHVSKYGGIGWTFDDFHCGSDSGYSALQLAAILGYKIIYLLGFDMCTSGRRTHCHNDYNPRPHQEYERTLNEYVPVYVEAFDTLRAAGVRVYSGSHISRLNRHLLYVDVRPLLCEQSA